MYCRNIISFIFIFVTAVIATVHNHPHSVTGSAPEVTDYHLTTEYPESSTREPEQQVTETAAVDLGALLDAGDGTVITLVAPQLPGMAPQLLAAADTYGLSALKAHCEQQVAAQLSVETAAAAAVLAVKHSSATLRQAAISFIKAHILHVMATRGWADAVNSQPEEFMKVMRLLFEAPEEASAAAAATSDVAPTTQPDSDHSGQTPASAAPTTAAPHTATPDYAAVCPLSSLSADEKNSRLIEAAKVGAVREVEALLAAGADVGAGNGWGQTALHWAAFGGHVEAARRLLAAGAAVEARTSVQRTPLHWAALQGNAAVVRLLVEEASADVNARNVDGRTPLHLAAYNGRAEAAAALLQAGAERAATDRWGMTPLDVARKYEHQRLVDMLTRS